jgi:hypothetical protein
VADRNGAGIRSRIEGGNLTITNFTFLADNENGLLGASDLNGTITIKNTEFINGTGWIYAQPVCRARLLLDRQDSYFSDAVVGHEIASRALNTTVTGSRDLDKWRGCHT